MAVWAAGFLGVAFTRAGRREPVLEEAWERERGVRERGVVGTSVWAASQSWLKALESIGGFFVFFFFARAALLLLSVRRLLGLNACGWTTYVMFEGSAFAPRFLGT